MDPNAIFSEQLHDFPAGSFIGGAVRPGYIEIIRGGLAPKLQGKGFLHIKVKTTAPNPAIGDSSLLFLVKHRELSIRGMIHHLKMTVLVPDRTVAEEFLLFR